MWQINGDKLSHQYTGTNSNISGVIENGKQGFTGKLAQMMTGVQRYIVNNYQDSEKNESIQILLNKGKYQKSYGIQHRLQQIMRSPEIRDQIDTWKTLKVGAITWNLAGRAPS
jgi:hypothetical protein